MEDTELLEVLAAKGWRVDLPVGRNGTATLRTARLVPNLSLIHNSTYRDFELTLSDGTALAVQVAMRDQSVEAAVTVIETLINATQS